MDGWMDAGMSILGDSQIAYTRRHQYVTQPAGVRAVMSSIHHLLSLHVPRRAQIAPSTAAKHARDAFFGTTTSHIRSDRFNSVRPTVVSWKLEPLSVIHGKNIRISTDIFYSVYSLPSTVRPLNVTRKPKQSYRPADP